MKTEVTFVLLSTFVFISKTMSIPMSWSSQLNTMYRTRTTKRLAEYTPTTKDLIEIIENGTQLAVKQCGETFKFDRWNCPQSAFSTRYKHPFSKEIAYTQAITAAGIVYAISKACSEGKIFGCGCDPERSLPTDNTIEDAATMQWPLNKEKETPLVWGGCSDYIVFAENVTRDIMKTLIEKGKDAQAHCTRRNYFLGRKIVRQTMQKQCKCRGPAANCEGQVCSLKLAPFEVVAMALKELYHKAVQVNFEHARRGLSIGNSGRISNKEIKEANPKALLYVERSPDYCKANPLISWPGTKGRPCSKSSNATNPAEKNSCKNICRACGHRVKKEVIPVSYDCNCSFQYCCEVKCDSCTKMVDTFHCV